MTRTVGNHFRILGNVPHRLAINGLHRRLVRIIVGFGGVVRLLTLGNGTLLIGVLFRLMTLTFNGRTHHPAHRHTLGNLASGATITRLNRKGFISMTTALQAGLGRTIFHRFGGNFAGQLT